MRLARKGLLSTLVVILVLLALAGAASAARPTRVLLVVMDQMQPGYAKQFGMTNILSLQQKGVWFPNAWVGDMASETVVSHNVMVSGLYPQHMGWSDEAFRDVDNLLGYGAGAIVTSGDLTYTQYLKIIDEYDYTKLGDYLHAKFPGTIVANVGQKGYQVESMAASSSDIYVRMGSKKNTSALPDPSVVPWTGKYRGPSGNGPGDTLPAYIKDDPRFLISSGNADDAYGTDTTTPAWMYYEDGRYVPGPYDGHLGGDNWVTDAATKIMENENWSGLFVTFSAIDKIGHMWGGGAVDTEDRYNWDPTSIFREIHMPWVAANADAQLGVLIAKLKELGQYKDTLIIVTADHGSTYGEHFYGTDVKDGANSGGWYCGTWYPGYGADPMVPNTAAGPAALAPLTATGNVAFSYQSTAIETWLVDHSTAKEKEAADVMATLPGVIASYYKVGDDHYKLKSASTSMTAAERSWWVAHGQALVDSMCWSGSADVVGLLADKTLYAAYGDHGGAQKDVQRIPMVWFQAGIKHKVNRSAFRLIDIMPTIMKTMGIAPTDRMDGSAYTIK